MEPTTPQGIANTTSPAPYTPPLFPPFMRMYMHTSSFGGEDTFKLLPMEPNCPYRQVVYSPSRALLIVVLNKEFTEMRQLPKLTPKGEYISLRPLKKGENPNDVGVQTERRFVTVCPEYYLIRKEEIIEFLEALIANPNSKVDWRSMLVDDMVAELPEESTASPDGAVTSTEPVIADSDAQADSANDEVTA